MIEIPIPVTRSFVQKHAELFFVYGIDVAEQGALGQCWHLHGEPNTGPVYTCWKMCKNGRYFSDGQLFSVCDKNASAVLDIIIRAQGRPIVVLPKIGRGGSRMFEFAPKCYDALMKSLDVIASKEVKFKY